jgi:hypothetical protein
MGELWPTLCPTVIPNLLGFFGGQKSKKGWPQKMLDEKLDEKVARRACTIGIF